MVSNHDPGPGRPDTETIAWFASLADLESWVHHHPTHAAIFAAGQAHSVRFAPNQKLLPGHEVAVTMAGAAEGIYLKCHARTGLLPFLPAGTGISVTHVTSRSAVGSPRNASVIARAQS